MITYAQTLPSIAWEFTPGVMRDGMAGFHVELVDVNPDGSIDRTDTYQVKCDVLHLPKIEVGESIDVTPYLDDEVRPFWTATVTKVWTTPCKPKS